MFKEEVPVEMNEMSIISGPSELYELGECYWEGKNGFEQNDEKAVEYYTKAAEAGNIDAVYSLGYCYAKGIGVKQNPEIAERLLLFAADKGIVVAAARLGEYLYWGDYLPMDKARGFLYLKYAADNGHANSMATVGHIYLSGLGEYDGWGPPVNLVIGKKYLDEACEKNSPYGMYLAGNNYRMGMYGYPENLEYGVSLLKSAAEGGHYYAQFQYALACHNGEGTVKDDKECIRWLTESASGGNKEAIVRLAWVKLIGAFPDITCRTQSELDQARDIIDDGLVNGDAFLNDEEVKATIMKVYAEEKRIGRRFTVEEWYGPEDSDRNSNESSDASSEGCYIATAVYGSYDSPEVWTLRRFRDFHLASKWYGRIFIKLYYAVSPTMVMWFGQTNWFQRLFKRFLDKKILKLKEQGYLDEPYYDR